VTRSNPARFEAGLDVRGDLAHRRAAAVGRGDRNDDAPVGGSNRHERRMPRSFPIVSVGDLRVLGARGRTSYAGVRAVHGGYHVASGVGGGATGLELREDCNPIASVCNRPVAARPRPPTGRQGLGAAGRSEAPPRKRTVVEYRVEGAAINRGRARRGPG